MTKEMRPIFEKGKWNDKRDTPAAAPPPCRLHFLMFSALHAEKAALLRRKNAFGRTTALLAPRMPSQNKKAIPYGMTFCFGGDKRDRTADLMTASHALSRLVRLHTPPKPGQKGASIRGFKLRDKLISSRKKQGAIIQTDYCPQINKQKQIET